jgi:hypothetical protein
MLRQALVDGSPPLPSLLRARSIAFGAATLLLSRPAGKIGKLILATASLWRGPSREFARKGANSDLSRQAWRRWGAPKCSCPGPGNREGT